jgi:hypothetical protein
LPFLAVFVSIKLVLLGIAFVAVVVVVVVVNVLFGKL